MKRLNEAKLASIRIEKRLVAERISNTLAVPTVVKELRDVRALVKQCVTEQALVKDAILYERLLILEASGMDPNSMIEMADGMLMTLETLATRIKADGLYAKVGKIEIPTVEQLKDAKTSKIFQNNFSTLGAVTKVLMSIADDISNLRAGEGGPLAEIMNTLRAATPEGHLGDMMAQYDAIDGGKPAVKKSFFSRKPKASKNVEQKMREALQTHLSKSPTAASVISVDDLLNGLKNSVFKDVVRSFAAYNASTAEYVDDNFLMSMSKQPITLKGMLKGAISSFFNVGSSRGR